MKLFALRMWAYIKALRAAESTAKELYAMSDRELYDIGITRSMIQLIKRQMIEDVFNGTSIDRKPTEVSRGSL